MSKLVELEETMTNATLFAVTKERDRIVRSFVENGFDLTKVSLKSFERAIKDKLWLAWQNAFAMGYEDEVQFGGADVDVAEFADELDLDTLDDVLDSFYNNVLKYKNINKKLKDSQKGSVEYEQLRKRLSNLRNQIKQQKSNLQNQRKSVENLLNVKRLELDLKPNDIQLTTLIADLEGALEGIDSSNEEYNTLRNVQGFVKEGDTIGQLYEQQQKTSDKKITSTKQKRERKPFEPTSYTEQFKQRTKVERLQESTKRKIRGYEAQLENLKNRNDDNANRLKIQLQNKIDTQKKILNDAVETLGDKTDTVVESALTDKFVEKTKQNKIYREVLERFQKDTTTNRANAISFLNQTDFGRVYLENRLDYIARIQSGREYDTIKKRLTESVKDQSDPIINNANETVIQRFFENMAGMRYDTQLRVTKDKNANQLSEADKLNLPLSKQRYDETIKNIPNFIVNDGNVMDMIYRRIRNAMYPDRLTFINTAKDILQNSQTNENGKYRLNEEQSRNFGFINKNEITKQTLQKYRNFTGAELKDHFASGIQRVFVTEIHAAHHLGRLTYYHLNDVKLVKWQLDDKKNIDAPCDRCLYAGNNNSKRLASILSYEAPSSWFEKKAKDVVNLSDSLDSIVTFAKDPIIYVNPLYAGRTDQDLKAIIKNQKAVIRQLQKNNIDVTEELQKVSVLEDELKNRINLVKQRAKDAKKIAKQAAEEQSWIKKNPMKDSTLIKYEKDTPQSNNLSQTIKSDKTEPTKPTQISQTKRNKNTSQGQSNNISQPTPTEKKPYKTVDIYQLKGIYFFDELLTDVNLSIPRHPYCRCRIVRLPYNEEQTLLALLGGEETVASAVSTGLGAASSLTMEEMIAAKETTKENRQWWTGLGKGAAIGAGILGAGFMMWYFIKTLKTPNKVTQGIGRVVKKGLMSVEDVAKAKEIEKITQEPLSKMPSKRAVKKATEEGRDLTEETIKRLKGQEEVAKVAEEIVVDARPIVNLTEKDESIIELVTDLKRKNEELQSTLNVLEDTTMPHYAGMKHVIEKDIERVGAELLEIGEQLRNETGSDEVQKETQSTLERAVRDLKNTRFQSVPENYRVQIENALDQYFSQSNRTGVGTLSDQRLKELQKKLNSVEQEDLYRIEKKIWFDNMENIVQGNLGKVNYRTYINWKNKVNSVKRELQTIDETLNDIRNVLPEEAQNQPIIEYLKGTIDEIIASTDGNVSASLQNAKQLIDKYETLYDKVEKIKAHLFTIRERFRYKTKTKFQPDPLVDNVLNGVTQQKALQKAEELYKTLLIKKDQSIDVKLFEKFTDNDLAQLIDNHNDVLNYDKTWERIVRSIPDYVNVDTLRKNYEEFVLWRNGELNLTQDKLKRIRKSFMFVLGAHIKRLKDAEFKRGYEGAEFSWRNMTLREACNIVQSRYSFFSTMSR